MRASVIVLSILLVPAVMAGQSGAPPARAQQAQAESTSMPVRRVVLYKAGVGYFEHLGTVRNDQDVTIRFTSAQLNDVLKSLTAIDLGRGQIAGINYNSAAPLDRRLGALRLPVDQDTTMVQLLTALRGARVEVTSGATVVSGRVLSVEQRTEVRGERAAPVQVLAVLTDAGEMRTFTLSPELRVRLAEREWRQELAQYLDVLGSTREQYVRSMVISTRGTGERQLFISYVSEVPIWKTSYRLVFQDQQRPLLQGWAIVDNTIGEDWTNVELSLVAGAPQSFIQEISQPYYGRRAVVPLPGNLQLQPQTHGATLRGGRGTVAGNVTDPGGGALPGALVEAISDGGVVFGATANAEGEYSLAVPAGVYVVRCSLAGFRTIENTGVSVGPGSSVIQDCRLHVGEIAETVSVTGGRVGGVVGGLPSAPPPPPPPAPARGEAYTRLKDMQAAAGGAELGELFEYRIKAPVTIQKNQSALVPIVNAEVTAERVSLWNRDSGSGRPLRALWITNSTGLTLDGGNMTIVEGGAFAGEGLIEPLQPSERRLVSYAADMNVMVSVSTQPSPMRLHRLRVRDGILIQDTEERSTATYDVRNEGDTPTVLVIEHRLDDGWTLAPGQTPAESTPGAERFRMPLAAKGESQLVVTQVSPGTSHIRLGDISEELIASLTATGASVDALQRALQPVLEKKAQIAALDRRIGALNNERGQIVKDQERLRENMKALRGSAEERQLLQRYTRQLDDQENRLDALRQELSAATAERATAQSELARLIGAISFEWTAPR